jgi:hypothetical protein
MSMRNKIFEISFNVQDPMPDFKDREFWGEFTWEEIKILWKHSGVSEERCEEIIEEWEQDTKRFNWPQVYIYFNYLFTRVKTIPKIHTVEDGLAQQLILFEIVKGPKEEIDKIIAEIVS